MITFMLPSIGAFTFDGSIILAVGVIAIAGILYKYRENISFNGNDIKVSNDESNINTVKYQVNEEKVNTNNKNSVVEEEEVYSKVEETVENFN